jgi:deoxyribonuclease V
LFAAVDVHYRPDGTARAALVTAPDPRFTTIAWSVTATTLTTAGYQPGEFWRRELPPLRTLHLGEVNLALLIVDGYVDLDPTGRPGLGAHVRTELGIPVIGVAKTFFRGAVHAAQVLRGQSARALYVTAAGISQADAVRLVIEMSGPHRIPDALRQADRLARGLEQPIRPAPAIPLPP